MKYRYTTVSNQKDDHGRYVRRPLIEVEMSWGSKRNKFLGLIDSGADQIIAPAGLADAFGIDRSTCRQRSTFGITMQPVPGFVGELTLHLQHQPEPFKAPVVFLDIDDVPLLLGREGFFDHYRIRFEQDHGTFEVVPVRKR